MKLWIMNILIRIKLLWIIKRKLILTIAALFTIAIIWFAIAIPHPHSEWFYIDWKGNMGTAEKCYVKGDRLLCKKTKGGMIDVQQYWKGD